MDDENEVIDAPEEPQEIEETPAPETPDAPQPED